MESDLEKKMLQKLKENLEKPKEDAFSSEDVVDSLRDEFKQDDFLEKAKPVSSEELANNELGNQLIDENKPETDEKIGSKEPFIEDIKSKPVTMPENVASAPVTSEHENQPEESKPDAPEFAKPAAEPQNNAPPPMKIVAQTPSSSVPEAPKTITPESKPSTEPAKPITPESKPEVPESANEVNKVESEIKPEVSEPKNPITPESKPAPEPAKPNSESAPVTPAVSEPAKPVTPESKPAPEPAKSVTPAVSSIPKKKSKIGLIIFLIILIVGLIAAVIIFTGIL